jgi:hypothetical protein
MRRIFLILALTCAMAGLTASVVTAAPAKAQALNCFVGGFATCTVTSDNTATLQVAAFGAAGVYVNGKSYSGKPLTAVHFSFNYSGDVGGGSPRLSIPINDGSGTTNYAFIDAAGCGYVSDDPLINLFHTVSTDDPACHVNYLGVDYANWDAFAADNPTFRIANGTLAFVVADQPGDVTIWSFSTR